MSDEEKPFDIFRQAPKKPKPKPPSRPESDAPKAAPPSDSEVKSMLEKITDLREEFTASLREVYHRQGLSGEQVTQFLDDAKNFTDRQWQDIQAQREKLRDELWQRVGAEKKKAVEERKKRKKAKRMRGKSLGSRKKWLEM